jgi:hypothetical protein
MDSETNIDGLNSSLYAPADFADADDLRPTAAIFDIAGNGSATPYTTAINGVIQKHIDEIKQKAALISLPTGWKQRLRGFLSQKNTDLLDFLSLSVSSHPSLGRGEQLIRKFSSVHFSPSNASVKELVLDASGADTVGEISQALLKLRTENGINDHLAAIRYIFDQYREAGEAALAKEAELKSKIDVLDRVQGKLAAVVDMDPTEAYEPLLEATESYVGKLFEKHQIADSYTGFIAAYRRFITLRDVVQMTRAVETNVNDPLCSICLNEQVGFALSPCGHTYCQTCVRRPSSTCFVCRGSIRDRVKLYFG